MKKEIVKIIDKLVDNAIRQYGVEDKKTITIAQNAENLKKKIFKQFSENLLTNTKKYSIIIIEKR